MVRGGGPGVSRRDVEGGHVAGPHYSWRPGGLVIGKLLTGNH